MGTGFRNIGEPTTSQERDKREREICLLNAHNKPCPQLLFGGGHTVNVLDQGPWYYATGMAFVIFWRRKGRRKGEEGRGREGGRERKGERRSKLSPACHGVDGWEESSAMWTRLHDHLHYYF